MLTADPKAEQKFQCKYCTKVKHSDPTTIMMLPWVPYSQPVKGTNHALSLKV